MTAGYSDIHRGFLQIVMSRGSISTDSANKVLVDLFASQSRGVPSEDDLQPIVDAINEKIHVFDQRIDIVTSQYDDKAFVVMVNTSQSAITKLQATYKQTEIEFFRLLMKEVAMAEEHSLRKISVLNIMNPNRNKDVNLTMTQLEKLLNDWIEEGYFYEQNGHVYFGVRSVAEFGEFLRSKFNVDSCQLCKSVLLKGVDCNGDTCNGRFHTSCLRKYMAKNTKCPKCKKVWSTPVP
ncbi:hypothetical protein HA402_011884 [Bradysia odoriphaga]|nr:hypothetical protein HA402_011884 [Bradysia odoriphaga]